MSIGAVVGRIDQIIAMQQQMVDPAAASAQGSSSSVAETIPGTTSATGTGTDSSSFSAALNSALGTSALGTDDSGTDDSGTDGTTDDTTGALTSMLATSGLTSGTGLGTTSLGTTGLGTTSLGTTSLGTTSIGTTGLASTGLATGTTTATGTAGAQVQAMTNMANSLVGKPYVYGGGHSGWGPQSGYDCSGFVSAVLHAGGYLSQPVDTTALPSQAGMESGPGQYVTVYDRALPGQSGHVIIQINGQFYESGGSHGSWGGGGGVEKIGTPSAAYLASFPNVLHPAGL
jgi:cell wall-associated NlpC family hydrolase